MELNKQLFGEINAVAHENLDKASGMLEMVNRMFGTDYRFLNRRVVFETLDNGVEAFHDAYTWAE